MRPLFLLLHMPLSQWLIRAAQGCKRAKQRLCAAEKRRALGRQDSRWPFPPTEGRPPGKLSPPQACCACPFSAHRRPVSKRLGAARPFRYAHEKNGFAVYAWARSVLPERRHARGITRKIKRPLWWNPNLVRCSFGKMQPALLGAIPISFPFCDGPGWTMSLPASSQHRFAFRFICRPTAAFPHCL